MCTVGPRGTYEASVLPTEGSWQLLGRDQSVLEETMGVPQRHREGHVAGRGRRSSPAKSRPFSLTSSPHPGSPLEAERFWHALPLPPTKGCGFLTCPQVGWGRQRGPEVLDGVTTARRGGAVVKKPGMPGSICLCR